MIKLKSLFRRQGPSNGSSKQSSNASSQIRGAASTSSLNSIGLSTASSSSTAVTPKSTKASLKKVPHTGSNDRFDSTFCESRESLDIKKSSSPKLYSTSSGGESTSGFISSLANSKSHSSIVVGDGASNSVLSTSTSPTGTPQHNKHHTRTELYQLSMTEHSPDRLIIGSTVVPSGVNQNVAGTCIGIVVAGELKDIDTEVGVDDGCGSCYSSSMRDLLSDELPEDCTFNGNDELQQYQIIQELQENLEQVARDKMELESKIIEMSSYKNDMLMLQSEIVKLQVNYDKAIKESQQLSEENESLRNRLRDVVNSPLSDTEKQQIIDDSQHRLHSSAPASIALPNNGEGSPCITTPDWDKHSSSSEVSVACLQDKIIQMEETHYSTNEELQATLQELADLQLQLSELQSDNDRLSEEKEVLFQSLCRQTEKLELLLRESDQQDAVMTTEREQKLLDLLKSAQEEV
ncbi:cytospin-A-like [Contarinia nasturtii]|uniref:cytospin-A-like n=1 Tax=Contarinia nasturtii TaxID=265458 RepID=UPI0012D41CE0|nr:cytospin-A-like [Contarinia nasturtii]XP_031617604.1 cytospin-A-like [Contarinia nasturtii]XP_031617605.1 cytospin-A-like [Contarinia nasturtii]XP_031617606.1 cytospin-A-like [Contarinia nasturtii]XP_031617607.1 cytospin-A-like [Contarinia nasturtii]XP_031617608.1 cytospin-A-like [Contarinia nasturtii]